MERKMDVDKKMKIIKNIEITTKIGCANMCDYCPQETLIKEYAKISDKFYLSIEDFSIIINKLPKEIDIYFTGMCEPFLNNNCMAMMEMASNRGHILSVSTTLNGFKKEYINRLEKLNFRYFAIHLPSTKGDLIPKDIEYQKLLLSVFNSNIENKYYHYHGDEIHPSAEIVKEIAKNHEINSRAGNLNKFESFNIKGRVLCSRNFDTPVLLLNGDLLICCMDYRLKNIIGNLITNTPEEIYNSGKFKNFLKSTKKYSGSICHSCDGCGTPFSMRNLIRIKLSKFYQATRENRYKCFFYPFFCAVIKFFKKMILNKNKICIILHDSNTKGANGAVLELIKSTKNKIDWLVFIPRKGPIISELISEKVPFVILPYKTWVSPPGNPIYKKMGRFILNYNPFIIFIFIFYFIKSRCNFVLTNTITIPTGMIAAKIALKKSLLFIHEFGYDDHGFVFDLGEKRSFLILNRLSDKVFLVSESLKDYFNDYFPEKKLVVIYQSVALFGSQFKAIKLPNKRSLQCFILGRVVEGKGQEDAILAIDLLKKRGIDVGLWVIGSGYENYINFLKNQVKERGLDREVLFFGNLDNPFQVAQRADLSLICSRKEGFGRVAVESMIMRKPVIATSNGANPELINSGYNGFLYSQGEPIELAEKISYFYKNKEELKRMGDNGFSFSKKFSPKEYSSIFLKEINNFL